MQRQLKILGVLYFFSGIAGLIGVVIIALPVFTGGHIVSIPSIDTAMVEQYTEAILIILIVGSLLSLLEGWGLLKGKSWARVLGLVLGAISLFDFPIGTGIGLYTIWTLREKDVMTQSSSRAQPGSPLSQ